MSIHIRQATKADAEHMIEFNAAMALETEGKTLDAATLERGVNAVIADAGKGGYFVAEVDGEVAGGLLITHEWSDWRNGDFWWIQSVYIRPQYRKHGVYSALHRFVEDSARAAANVCGVRLYVDKDNERARRTYERLGMRPARYDFYETDLSDLPVE